MIVGSRKRQFIGDRVLQNKTICDVPPNSGCAPACSQKCRSKRCKCCILMAERGEVLHINGQNLSIPVDFDCTTFNVIYVAQCRLCDPTQIGRESTYFGQTIQPLHCRFNGHCSKFNNVDYKKSALSWHAYISHPDIFIWKFLE